MRKFSFLYIVGLGFIQIIFSQNPKAQSLPFQIESKKIYSEMTDWLSADFSKQGQIHGLSNLREKQDDLFQIPAHPRIDPTVDSTIDDGW
jgi:hypothetical protein